MAFVRSGSGTGEVAAIEVQVVASFSQLLLQGGRLRLLRCSLGLTVCGEPESQTGGQGKTMNHGHVNSRFPMPRSHQMRFFNFRIILSVRAFRLTVIGIAFP